MKLLMVLLIPSLCFAAPREVIIAHPSVYLTLRAWDWPVSPSPVYNADSTRVLFDRNVNQPFTAGELEVLAGFLDVEVVPFEDGDPASAEYLRRRMIANGWPEEEEI